MIAMWQPIAIGVALGLGAFGSGRWPSRRATVVGCLIAALAGTLLGWTLMPPKTEAWKLHSFESAPLNNILTLTVGFAGTFLGVRAIGTIQRSWLGALFVGGVLFPLLSIAVWVMLLTCCS